MSKYDLRMKARRLRRQGLSIKDIKERLGVSKSSVSIWCRDIELSKKQERFLLERRIKQTSKGRLIGALKNKQKRLDSIRKADLEAISLIKRLNQRDLLLVVASLYWAEGSKSEKSFGFQFINSDPDMVLTVVKFLRISHVAEEDIHIKIQINLIHKPRIKEVLNFWKKLLELSDSQIGKTSFIKTVPSKVYENYDNYFGICRLGVRKSTLLKYQFLGLIKALKTDILSR